MKDKIYLDVKQDKAGNIRIVDQDGRELYGVRKLQINADFDEAMEIRMSILAGKREKTKEGISYFVVNGRRKEINNEL